MSISLHLRLAYADDVASISQLVDLSVRGLQAKDYSSEQLQSALETVYGVDSQLLADETYFVVEHQGDDGTSIVGCGGWSKRKTLYGGDQCVGREPDLLNPTTDAAKIRAFFVHPNFVRRGIGTQILQACEHAAEQAGFVRLEMGATLTGVPFYTARGYVVEADLLVPLSDGLTLPIKRMVRSLR